MNTMRAFKFASSTASEAFNHFDFMYIRGKPGIRKNTGTLHLTSINTRSYSTVEDRRLTYYEMMELTPKASQKQIKAAYYRLSKKFHPDVNAAPDAKEKFAMLAEAYEVLGSRRTRSLYDSGSLRPSDVGRQSSTSDNPGGVDDEYKEFFKQRSSPFKSRGSAQPPTGKTTIYDFDEFYRQHYGEQIRRNQAEKQEHKWRDSEGEKLRAQQRRMVAMYSVLMFCAAVFVAIGGRSK